MERVYQLLHMVLLGRRFLSGALWPYTVSFSSEKVRKLGTSAHGQLAHKMRKSHLPSESIPTTAYRANSTIQQDFGRLLYLFKNRYNHLLKINIF
jgi:hypothetical protein